MGIEQAFGLIAGDQKPYNPADYDRKQHVAIFYRQERRVFNVRDYTEYFRNITFREGRHADYNLSDMIANLDEVRLIAEKLLVAIQKSSWKHGEPGEIEEAFDTWANKHIGLWLDYIRMNGNMASAMVTGPSNFPVARQRKLNDRHHNKYVAISDHRKAAPKILERAAWPHGAPGDAIRGNDPEAIEKLEAKIADAKAYHERLKKGRADVRKAKKKAGTNTDPAAIEAALIDLGYERAIANTYSKPMYGDRGPIEGPASWQLTNNNANIKRMEGRLKELTAKRDRAPAGPQKYTTPDFEFELVENTEADRIQLLFEGKPLATVRALLKQHGFRWAPSHHAWQRHLNENGRYAAANVIKKIQEQN